MLVGGRSEDQQEDTVGGTKESHYIKKILYS